MVTGSRLVDLVVATVLLIPFGLVTLMLVLVNQSFTLSFFSQTRLGRNESKFIIFKFRTMVCGTPDLPSHEVENVRVTRVGSWLRKTKLDELPQILNLFAGNMTLVGPRPCLPSQKELISERRRRNVFDVKPGITGWAQVMGFDMSRPKQLARIESLMIRQSSLCNFIGVLWFTVIGRGSGDRVRKSDY